MNTPCASGVSFLLVLVCLQLASSDQNAVIASTTRKAGQRDASARLGPHPVGTDVQLFVDDVLENVEGARAVGMQAVHFADPELARQQLREITGVA